jgi:hypothetical protein
MNILKDKDEWNLMIVSKIIILSLYPLHVFFSFDILH